MKRVSHLRNEPLPELFAISRVNVWNASQILPDHTVIVSKGVIQEISPNQPASFKGEILSADGLALLPAGLDVQAHLRVPGQPNKELPETGLRAALRGGYGALLTMPNTDPVIDSVEVLRRAQNEISLAEKKTGVQVFWSAALSMGQNGKSLVDFEALARAGVKAFTDDGKGLASDDLMDQAFAQLEKLEIPLLQHAEVPGHGGVIAPSSVQKKLGVTPYFDDPEWRMVERDLHLLAKHPRARYHVLHVSAAKTLQLVKAAKQKGLRASCEVSPHHLLLNAEQIDPNNTSYKMNPPLRSEDDRTQLLRGLVEGDVDFVATDHAPHEHEKKAQGFAQAPFGTIGLEASLRVLLDFQQKGWISPKRLVEVFSAKPAQFLGVDSHWGQLAAGRSFAAVLVDPNRAPQALSESEIESLNTNSCFVGHKLGGEIRQFFLANQVWTSDLT